MLKVMVRELRRMLTLPAFYILLVVMPPLLLFFYAFIYEKGEITDLPMGIWDESRSPASRELTFLLEQMESIRIAGQLTGQADLQERMHRGEILGALHFPQNMEEDMLSGQPVTITLYTNASSLVPAKLLYKQASEVMITGGAEIILERLTKSGMEPQKAMALVEPVRLTTYPMYNPTYNYFRYLVPGLVTVALQMILIMTGVLLLNDERSRGTWNELLALARGSAFRILTGKLLAHLALAWVSFILVAGILFPLFGIAHPAATAQFFLLYTLLALACTAIGLCISAIVNEPMLASDIALFYTAPAFVFSGYTFPRWAMPWYDQFYARLMPYSSFLDGFIKLYQMQVPLRFALPEMGTLLLFILLPGTVAWWVLRRRILAR